MGRFIPYATMFKIPHRKPTRMVEITDEYKVAEIPRATLVGCVACNQEFPLKDLLRGELEEDWCPTCGTRAGDHWLGKECLVVPPDRGPALAGGDRR